MWREEAACAEQLLRTPPPLAAARLAQESLLGLRGKISARASLWGGGRAMPPSGMYTLSISGVGDPRSARAGKPRRAAGVVGRWLHVLVHAAHPQLLLRYHPLPPLLQRAGLVSNPLFSACVLGVMQSLRSPGIYGGQQTWPLDPRDSREALVSSFVKTILIRRTRTEPLPQRRANT